MTYKSEIWLIETRGMICELNKIMIKLKCDKSQSDIPISYKGTDFKTFAKNVIRRKNKAEYLIRQVSNCKMQRILQKYYIDGLTWEHISEDIGCSVRWIYVLHKRALPLIENIFINLNEFLNSSL